MYGYSLEKALTMSMSDFLAPYAKEETNRIIEQNLQRFLAGKPVPPLTVDIDQQRKNGSIFPSEVTATFAWNEDGEPMMIGITHDISERKRDEEALRDSHNTLQAVFDAAIESIILIDLQGNILSINQTGARRLNTTPSECTGMYLFGYIPPELAKARVARMKELIRTRKPIYFEDERRENISNTIGTHF
jgi:PAS domain S-box-containing protein